MEWLRRRDPAVLAIVVTLVGALVVLTSVNLDRLPWADNGVTYHAQFANASGLKDGDDVRVAGITVGEVTSIAVDGGHVDVGFTVRDGLALGRTSGASIELATVLGALFVQVESAGPGRLAGGAVIPLRRTSVPFTLIDTLSTLGATAAKTDLPTFRRSLDQLAATLQGIAPRDVRATLTGLTRISTALASRQDGIAALLADTDTVLKTLASRRDSLVRLMGDAATFSRMLHDRRTVIDSLLRNTSDLGRQVSVLIARNGARLGSVLREVNTVAGVLANDSRELTRAISMLGQFSTNISNVTGSGPWIDVLLPTFLQPDNLIAACGPRPVPGCGRP